MGNKIVLYLSELRKLIPYADDLVSLVSGGAPVGEIATLADAQTLTNKRIDPRVDSQASTSTITPEISAFDMYVRTLQATNILIKNHVGTGGDAPNNGNKQLIVITGDATPRSITYESNYVGYSGLLLPSVTVASSCTKLLFMWRSSISKYDLIGLNQQ